MKHPLLTTLLRTLLPIAIGVGAGLWLFHRDISASGVNPADILHFNSRAIAGLALAFLFVVGRDFGLSWRFHTIADGALSWARSVKVDLMCAFTSAITPSVVGGSALAIFYLNREGLPVGRATTLTLTTLFLDELFFVVFCPVIILLFPSSELFAAAASAGLDAGAFLKGVEVVFWLVYAGIVIWTGILFMAIIARPEATARVLRKIAGWRLLRRYGKGLSTTADNMEATAAWVKGRPLSWWLRVFGATVVSWFSRYFVVNALFWGFVPAASGLLVFARQFVVWVVLMVCPTPGGSGVSEWLFSTYYGDLIGSLPLALMLALLWRLLSYYVYLLAGTCLLPSYFRKKK